MTIAVIGHGRSPEDKRWGGAIDRCDAVVRMWDWTWQPAGDYGTKYDYGLFVLTPKQLQIFQQYNLCEPRKKWLAYLGKPTENVFPFNAELVDTVRWCVKARELGGVGLSGMLTLTRGCVAACWAIEHAVKGEAVVLVGFDNVLIGINQPIEKSFCPAYWQSYMSRFAPNAEKVYPIGQAKTATHDMAVERPLLKLLAEERNVSLHFAQEYW